MKCKMEYLLCNHINHTTESRTAVLVDLHYWRLIKVVKLLCVIFCAPMGLVRCRLRCGTKKVRHKRYLFLPKCLIMVLFWHIILRICQLDFANYHSLIIVVPG